MSAVLAKMGVPKRYVDARVGDFKSAGAVNTEGLFLCGSSGTGKTHMATAVMAQMIPAILGDMPDERFTQPGRTPNARELGRWVTVPDLLLELRDTMTQRDTQTERDVIDVYASRPLLVLDDLGAEKASEWTSQSLYTILSRRINNMLPTIVTSNLTLQELHESDPRMASRLGGMTYVRLEGEDRRLKA